VPQEFTQIKIENMMQRDVKIAASRRVSKRKRSLNENLSEGTRKARLNPRRRNPRV